MNPQPTTTFVLPQRLLQRCRYPRLTGPEGTVLMVDAGYFIQHECRRAFHACGWQTFPVPLYPPEEFVEKLLTAVVVHKPDMLFTINHLGFDVNGLLTELLEAIEMPVVSWFVDSPAYILLDHTCNATPLAITPIWERAYESFLKQFGFQHTFHLPLAGDPAFIRRESSNQLKYRISFAGDSMTFAVAKWSGLCTAIPGSGRLIERAAAELYHDRRRNPREIVRELSFSFGIDLAHISREMELTLSSAIVLEATRLYRREMVNKLDGFKPDIFGDEGWSEYASPNANLHGRIDYYTELPDLYGSTAVNLNNTSLQMPTALNQRVFDAPLAGGFLLTDNQEDLGLIFNKSRETATFSSPDELPEKVAFYLAHDSLREKLIDSAREKIVTEHLYAHRIARIINLTRQLFGNKLIKSAVSAL